MDPMGKEIAKCLEKKSLKLLLNSSLRIIGPSKAYSNFEDTPVNSRFVHPSTGGSKILASTLPPKPATVAKKKG